MSEPHEPFQTDDEAAFIRDRKDESNDQWFYTPDGERKTLSNAVRTCRQTYWQKKNRYYAPCMGIWYERSDVNPKQNCPYCGREIEVTK